MLRMKIQQTITDKLQQALKPEYLEVVNESHMHSVPPNSETHFKVVAVAGIFDGKRSVARHQQIYGLLSEELAGPVHALALHTYTQQEWELAQQQAPASPNCMGGSKAD
jgi:BolA protein